MATITDGAGTNPMWLSDDASTIYAAAPARHLAQSTDDGATWTLLHQFPKAVQGVRQLANGEMLVATVAVAGPGGLYLSSGFPEDGAAAAWSLVLTAADASSYFNGSWGMSTHGTVVAVAEYGGKTPGDQARFVHLSRDYGATWDQIYDAGSVASTHTHGVAFDPWWDAVWVTVGDGSGTARTVVSFDWGDTWTTITPLASGQQFTGILPMADCILFMSDSPPNGVYRMDRSGGRDDMSLVLAYSLSGSAGLTHVGTMPFHLDRTQPAVLSFLALSGPGLVLTTPDGSTFSEVWQDSVSYTNQGPTYVVGPTATGLLVGTLNDDRQVNYSRLTLPLPDYERKALVGGNAVQTFGANRIALGVSS